MVLEAPKALDENFVHMGADRNYSKTRHSDQHIMNHAALHWHIIRHKLRPSGLLKWSPSLITEALMERACKPGSLV